LLIATTFDQNKLYNKNFVKLDIAINLSSDAIIKTPAVHYKADVNDNSALKLYKTTNADYNQTGTDTAYTPPANLIDVACKKGAGYITIVDFLEYEYGNSITEITSSTESLFDDPDRVSPRVTC
jgi:hypothetical protein